MMEGTHVKSKQEIEEYITMMEKDVRGIQYKNGNCLPDQYDKGWYEALRWVMGTWP